MKSGYLDWAIDDPAPGNCGYSILGIPWELADTALRRGLVVHSVEGWFTYVSPSAVMRARGNSWGVTIMRSGQVWKHRPRPTFVNWHAGGPAQNIGTDGIEMEGRDQPWTTAQRASLVQVLQETRAWFAWSAYAVGAPTAKTQESIRQALLGRGYGSLWEHNWVDYTTCPSGRNEWEWLMSQLEEDGMVTVDQLQAWATAHDEQVHRGFIDPKLIEIEAKHGGLQAWAAAHDEQVHRGFIDPKLIEQEGRIASLEARLAALETPAGGRTHDHSIPAGRTGEA